MSSNEDIVNHLKDFASSYSMEEEALEYLKDNDLVQYHTRTGDILLTVTVPEVPAGTVLDWAELARDYFRHINEHGWWIIINTDNDARYFNHDPDQLKVTNTEVTFNGELEME